MKLEAIQRCATWWKVGWLQQTQYFLSVHRNFSFAQIVHLLLSHFDRGSDNEFESHAATLAAGFIESAVSVAEQLSSSLSFSAFLWLPNGSEFEKQTSDVHSSHSHGLGKLLRETKRRSDEENGWLIWIVTHASRKEKMEEEEEFAVATRLVKSSKSATACTSCSQPT